MPLQNVFVGGENRWAYDTFTNWEFFWPNFPVIAYFKVTRPQCRFASCFEARVLRGGRGAQCVCSCYMQTLHLGPSPSVRSIPHQPQRVARLVPQRVARRTLLSVAAVHGQKVLLMTAQDPGFLSCGRHCCSLPGAGDADEAGGAGALLHRPVRRQEGVRDDAGTLRAYSEQWTRVTACWNLVDWRSCCWRTTPLQPGAREPAALPM